MLTRKVGSTTVVQDSQSTFSITCMSQFMTVNSYLCLHQLTRSTLACIIHGEAISIATKIIKPGMEILMLI